MEPIGEKWLWREAKLEDTGGKQRTLLYAGKNRPNPAWRVQNN